MTGCGEFAIGSIHQGGANRNSINTLAQIMHYNIPMLRQFLSALVLKPLCDSTARQKIHTRLRPSVERDISSAIECHVDRILVSWSAARCEGPASPGVYAPFA
jgi:hypothetical protein